jgi:predicted metal-dependent phosphoesterase TrpH
MKEFRANFHIHTRLSDGKWTVAQVVEEIARQDIEYFSITDHDRIDGNKEAATLALQFGLKHTNGVELSCGFGGELGLDFSHGCHILGYDFDYDKMKKALQKIEQNKRGIIHQLFSALVSAGYKLPESCLFADGSFPKRTQIAQVLVAAGYASSANEAYEKILNSPSFLPFANNRPSIKQGIKTIKDCGGIAVWAHPFELTKGGKFELSRQQVKAMLPLMLSYGIDGMEVYYHNIYGQFSAEQICFLEGLANESKLIKSVGTDFHFPSESGNALLCYSMNPPAKNDMKRLFEEKS